MDHKLSNYHKLLISATDCTMSVSFSNYNNLSQRCTTCSRTAPAAYGLQ